MNHFIKRVTMVTVISIISFSSVAQYGNEWIDYSQSYYKVKISQEGVYRLDHTVLQDAGVPVGTFNPKNIQIFRHGEEIPIYVKGESDNSFDATDYVEFYAKENDGKLDTKLFGSVEQQGHNNLSLYEEEAVYFITWSNTPSSNHLSDFYDGNYVGKTADDYYIHTSWLTPKEDVYDGAPFSSPGNFSTYTKGEGFYSSHFSGTREVVLSVPSDNFVTSGPAPTYEIYAGGKSNPMNVMGGINHEMQVRAMKNGTSLQNKQFFGYDHFKLTGTLSANDMEPIATSFGFSSVLGDKEAQAVSYVKLMYPRAFSLNNLGEYNFDYASANNYIRLEDNLSGKSTPFVIDFANKQLIKADATGSTIEFNRSVSTPSSLYVYDATEVHSLLSSDLSSIDFVEYNLSANSDFIILTHSSLSNSASDYKAYRESTVGGGHKALVAFTDDIYNQFYYGQHHPLALKNFTHFLVQEQTQSPEYLLLLGKGYSYDQFYGGTSKSINQDLVPTYGTPPSDILLTSEPELDDLTPSMATGRVPASTNAEVLNYLDKVKLHELYQNQSRDYITITGGATLDEQSQLNQQQKSIFDYAKTYPYTASEVPFVKSNNSGVSIDLKDSIQAAISNGASVIDFLGHGTSQVLEVDWGNVADWDNIGKYPLTIVSSSIGNVFADATITEELLLTEDFGAVAVVAPTTFIFIGPYFEWTKEFHNQLFINSYGEPFGKQVQKTIENYQNPANTFNKAQCNQMNYFGDPALKLYSPQNGASVFPVNKSVDNAKLYPNPTTGIVNIKGKGIIKIEVYNTIGSLIVETTELKVDLSNQPMGTYFVSVISEENKSVQKVVLTK